MKDGVTWCWKPQTNNQIQKRIFLFKKSSRQVKNLNNLILFNL